MKNIKNCNSSSTLAQGGSRGVRDARSAEAETDGIENSAARRRAVNSNGLENSRNERGHLRDSVIARGRHSLDIPRGSPALPREIRRERETIIHSFYLFV
jgi:hypothetical protein